MSTINEHKRILAVDVRSRSFGFAVFEGPKQLLDCGVRSFRPGVNAVQTPASKRFGALLDEFAPAVVVLNKRAGNQTRRHIGLLDAVTKQAERRKIPCRFLPRTIGKERI